VQLSDVDAAEAGIGEGDTVEVSSRRGSASGTARVGGIEPGTVFMPFHFGTWDRPGQRQAANELTLTGWDPVSKQPYLKYSAVRIRRLEVAHADGESDVDSLESVGDGRDRDPGTVAVRDLDAVVAAE
jgi:predicted molibdopterin-dependent oxidoreductase YjgC